MLICCNTVMDVSKNGVGVSFEHGVVYPADEFKCGVCGKTVLRTTENSVNDPQKEMFVQYYYAGLKADERKGVVS